MEFHILTNLQDSQTPEDIEKLYEYISHPYKLTRLSNGLDVTIDGKTVSNPYKLTRLSNPVFVDRDNSAVSHPYKLTRLSNDRLKKNQIS